MNYVFENANNGHYFTYTPFTCDKSLTQEFCDEIINKNVRGAGRTGSNLEMLGEILDKLGYKIEPYHCTYKKHVEVSEFYYILGDVMANDYIHRVNEMPYDWLPNDFKDCPIIKGICGNY